MTDRREFFEVQLDFAQLDEHAQSADSTLRWAAAIELGQLASKDSIDLLWRLTNDLDENVRDAANLSLQQCDQELVSQVLTKNWHNEIEQEPLDNEIAPYVAWKVRPLEVPTSQNNWIAEAAVLNIVQTESPILGSRLLRLYGSAVYPNSPKKLPKSRIQSALRKLELRGLVAINDNNGVLGIEQWLIYRAGQPEVFVRSRGPRKLGEIPVSEVIGYLKFLMGDDYLDSSSDARVELVVNAYEIKQPELHILGAVLTEEWVSLLT